MLEVQPSEVQHGYVKLHPIRCGPKFVIAHNRTLWAITMSDRDKPERVQGACLISHFIGGNTPHVGSLAGIPRLHVINLGNPTA